MNNGIWRTVGGRRVFIKNGQSLSEAMIESGKFSSRKNNIQKYDYSDFSKSKVKETLYHGSKEDFDKFDIQKNIEGNNAFWFTDDIDYAEEMATVRDGKNMYEVKINMQNPLEIEMPQREFADPTSEKKYIERAKQQGYDGVIFKNENKNDIFNDTFYAVFNSEQIKIIKKYKFTD